MSDKPKILAFAGSIRKESYNQKLIQNAARIAEEAGAEVRLLTREELNLPLFSEDLEAEGTPPAVKKLKSLFLEHQGLLISAPEYNSSITPLLKNVIDWVSRPVEGQPRLAEYQGKTAGLLAASPGGLGGLRGLVHVRDILGNIGVHVIPAQAAISQAHEAFDDDGNLTDESAQKRVRSVVEDLVETTAKLNR